MHFLFVVKRIIAVLSPEMEQVPVSIFALADQRAASAAELRLSGGVVTYSPESVIKNKKIRRARKQVGVAARRFGR